MYLLPKGLTGEAGKKKYLILYRVLCLNPIRAKRKGIGWWSSLKHFYGLLFLVIVHLKLVSSKGLFVYYCTERKTQVPVPTCILDDDLVDSNVYKCTVNKSRIDRKP